MISGLISYSLPIMSEHLVSDHHRSSHSRCCLHHPDHQKSIQAEVQEPAGLLTQQLSISQLIIGHST